MINKIIAPIPIPGIQLVAGFESSGVDVGVGVLVFVGVGAVAVGVNVGVGVDVDVEVRVVVNVGVGVDVKVGGIEVFVGLLFSGAGVQGIDPPAASTQAPCAFAFLNGVNRIVKNKITDKRSHEMIRMVIDFLLSPHLDKPSSLIHPISTD